MKILILANPNSSHTIKWAKSLAKRGLEIYIFGIEKLVVKDYTNIKNIKIKTLNSFLSSKKEGAFSKITYLKALPTIKKIIKEFKPDIVHAHYASSYGLLGALSNFSPFIISIWGSDIFSFPKRSILHRKIIEFNLKKATTILSTSNIMAKEARKYTNKEIKVIPFGVDLEIFKPFEVKGVFNKEDIVIGTIKALEKEYGIDKLIKLFSILVKKYPYLPLKLLIVGGGSLEKELKELAKKLNIENKTTFTGKVDFKETPKYHNMISIFVALSNSESFGVAVIEASATKKPVVVSNVGGLVEVVEDKKSGFIVNNLDEAVKRVEKLIFDKKLCQKMGENGRNRVKKLYNWQNNVSELIEIYKGLK